MGQVAQNQDVPRYMSSSEAIEYAKNRYLKENGKMPVADLSLDDIGESENEILTKKTPSLI